MQYRLMTGDHEVTETRRAPDGRVLAEHTRIVNTGAVVESDQDLCALFNKPGTRPKFEQLHTGAPHGGYVFDPKVESIESFAHRMKQLSRHDSAAPPIVITPLPFPQEKATAPAPQPFQHVAQKPVEPAFVRRDTIPAPQQSPGLSDAQMTMMGADQLREYCDGEEIPYDPAADKAQLVEIIRAFQGN